jgi:hypothetical protein
LQGAGLHQHRGDRTATLVEPSLDDQALGRAVLGRRQFEHFRLQQHVLEQVVDALTRLGRHRNDRHVAAILLGHHLVGDQLLLHAIGVGFALVDLVDRHDHRHLGRLGVVDGLDRLGHHAVVGRHHQDDDVGGRGAARPHRGEGLVARGVEEGDDTARRGRRDTRRCAA